MLVSRVSCKGLPPAKADLYHDIVYAMVRLSGRFAPNRHVRTRNQISFSIGRSLDATEIADSE